MWKNIDDDDKEINLSVNKFGRTNLVAAVKGVDVTLKGMNAT